MKMRSCKLVAVMVTASFLLACRVSPGSVQIFDTFSFGSDPVNVQVSFDDMADPGNVNVAINVLPDAGNPNIADIRGLLINITDDSKLPGISVLGADVTNVEPPGSVSGDLNVNPVGPWDLAIEIGNPGIGGGDDFQSTTFTIDHDTMALTTSMFTTEFSSSGGGSPISAPFGVRLTSTGPPGSARDGSSKLGGNPDPFFPPDGQGPIPEPTSAVVWGLLVCLLVGRYVGRR